MNRHGRDIADILNGNPYRLAPQEVTAIAASLRDYGVPWSEAVALLRRLPTETEPKPLLRDREGDNYGKGSNT